jgi:hypothetical protein
MTVMADLNAVSLTASSKAACAAKGIDIGALVSLAKVHCSELNVVLKQIVSSHPTSGGDAANSAALTAVIAELV